MQPAELQAWRERRGISQAQLARDLDVDVMTISRWERGERAIPSLLRLALVGWETENVMPRPRRQ